MVFVVVAFFYLKKGVNMLTCLPRLCGNAGYIYLALVTLLRMSRKPISSWGRRFPLHNLTSACQSWGYSVCVLEISGMHCLSAAKRAENLGLEFLFQRLHNLCTSCTVCAIGPNYTEAALGAKRRLLSMENVQHMNQCLLILFLETHWFSKGSESFTTLSVEFNSLY